MTPNNWTTNVKLCKDSPTIGGPGGPPNPPASLEGAQTSHLGPRPPCAQARILQPAMERDVLKARQMKSYHVLSHMFRLAITDM